MAETQEYSPLNPQPYQPTQAPPTPEAKPSPLQDSPGFQFQGHGNISHAGAIAGVFDNVLKGFVNGHAMGEAHKALTLKKTSDDLNSSYNQAAQRLYQMKASGVDEKTPEYQAAKSAVDGAWGALQTFRGQLIDQQQSGGKKKPAKGAKTGQDDPMMALSNPAASPQEKAAALLAISKKLGAPVYGQIAALNTPQAQQARATQNTMGDADSAHATNTLTHEQAQATYNKYAGKTDDEMAALPEAEQQAYRNARAVLLPPTNKGTTREYVSPDGKTRDWFVPGNQPEGYTATASSGTTRLYKRKDGTQEWYRPGEEPEGATAVGSAAAKPVRAWTKDASGKFTSVLVDPMTNQKIPGTENGDIAPPASLSGHITTGDFHWVDSEGNQHSTTETHTTTPLAAASGKSSSSEAAPKPVNPPTVVTQSFHGKKVPGMLERGNIDIANRPNIDNGDGTHSTTFSTSFGTDKGEVLVSGVGDGTTYPLRQLRVLYTLPDGSQKWEVPGNQPSDWKAPKRPTPQNNEALDQYQKTGKFFMSFKDENGKTAEQNADAYGKKLHEDQQKYGNTPKPANTTRRERVRTSAPPPAAAAATGTPGDRILGHKGTPDEQTAKKNADTLELAARQSLERMKNPTPIGDTGIVFNWVRAQVAGAGRMTNTEIQQAVQSGSMGTKFKNAYDRATKGTLDPQFRREMVDDTLMSARQARIVANSYKPKTAAAPRPQGVPSNYVQFKDSEGNSHWIDPSKLDTAKSRDPKLQVIQ